MSQFSAVSQKKKQSLDGMYLQILPPVFPFQFASTCFKLWCTSLQRIWQPCTVHKIRWSRILGWV